MAIIKPISDLRNKSNEISELVNSSSEPVFITKNGEGNMVLMSITFYRNLVKKAEVFSKLAEAELMAAEGDKGKEYKAVIRDIKKNLRGKK
jgi:prevent-host-death family protein